MNNNKTIQIHCQTATDMLIEVKTDWALCYRLLMKKKVYVVLWTFCLNLDETIVFYRRIPPRHLRNCFVVSVCTVSATWKSSLVVDQTHIAFYLRQSPVLRKKTCILIQLDQICMYRTSAGQLYMYYYLVLLYNLTYERLPGKELHIFIIAIQTQLITI